MSSCCHDKSCAPEALRDRQSRILWIVLGINSVMFGAEVVAGLLADSVALLADSLDMLGDALVYGFSLFVVGRSARWRAGAALLKGGIMMVFGLGVLLQAIHKVTTGTVPDATLIGIMGCAALVANAVCLLLLTRHKSDDINMRSTWVCSRNDIIANAGVILAAGGVFLTGSMWPDILISLLITGVFIHSAVGVLRDALVELELNDYSFPGWHLRSEPTCSAGTCPAGQCKC